MGTPVEHILQLGGWGTPNVFKHHNIEESYLVPGVVVRLYAWLKAVDPFVKLESVQHVR